MCDCKVCVDMYVVLRGEYNTYIDIHPHLHFLRTQGLNDHFILDHERQGQWCHLPALTFDTECVGDEGDVKPVRRRVVYGEEAVGGETDATDAW